MKSEVLPPGTPAPDFVLTDHLGRSHRLQQYLGQVVLLVFYRGFWCNSCRRQLGQFRSEFQEFADREVTVLAVSVEPADETRRAIKDESIPFVFLRDPTLEVITSYGVRHRRDGDEPDIAHPGVFVLDQEGIVRFAYVGAYPEDRPALGTILLALDQLDR